MFAFVQVAKSSEPSDFNLNETTLRPVSSICTADDSIWSPEKSGFRAVSLSVSPSPGTGFTPSVGWPVAVLKKP